MAVTSNRSVTLQFAGDVEYTQSFDAMPSSPSPGDAPIKTSLSSGNNTITVPSNTVGVTILMPAANTVQVTLKGVNGDTGIALSLTDPTSFGVNSVSTFVLNAASAVTVRIAFS